MGNKTSVFLGFGKKMFAILFAALLCNTLLAQQPKHKPVRCGTMEAIDLDMKANPTLKAEFDKKMRIYEDYRKNHKNTLQKGGSTARTLDPANPITIPVVVHIVMANPNMITDADVQAFIDRINEDFTGVNADSTNGVPYYPIRGHCGFKFALARRTPAGLSTTGIERKAATTKILGANPQPIKAAATGLAPWDITKYYNIWVGGATGGILGISPAIGPGTQTGNAIDGVCIDTSCFSNNPCITDPNYNLARTAVHEIGHNFGLFHTFQGGCADQDFGPLTSAGCTLPLGLTTDDTPPLAVQTTDCPTLGNAPNGCTPVQEKMFQNYMDYTQDACYSMFTNGQVTRMEWVLENCRSGYLTTQGHLPPAGAKNQDIALIKIINPGGSEYDVATCKTKTYAIPSCGDGLIDGRIQVQNRGFDDIFLVNVGFLCTNNGVTISQGIIQNNPTYIKPGYTEIFDLPTLSLQTGTNIVKFFANTGATGDSIPTNDTLTLTISGTFGPGLKGVYTMDKRVAPSGCYPFGGSRIFRNFTDLANYLKCGIDSNVIVNVEPGSGVYNEQFLITGKIPGATGSKTITINGRGETIKFNMANTSERSVIKLKGANNFIFDSLVVDATGGTYGIGFQFLNNADSNIVKHCTINSLPNNTTAANSAGIVIGGLDNNPIGSNTAALSDYNLISDNVINGGVYGVVIAAGAGGESGNNTVINNTIDNFYQYGIYSTGVYNTIYEANKIGRTTRSADVDFNGIYLTAANKGVRVVRNRIHSPFAGFTASTKIFNGININNVTMGVSPTNADKLVVGNNLIYNIQGSGNQIGILNTGTSNCIIVNNTINLDDATAVTAGAATTRGYSQTGTATALTFMNNLITISRGGSSIKHCVYFTTKPADLNNNDYFMDAVSGSNYIGYLTTNYPTLGGWQTALAPLETKTLNFYPYYKQPAVDDYHPTNAALNNKGTYVISNDILNLPRPQTPDTSDIGCYEFYPSLCSPGSLNGNTVIRVNNNKVISDTTVCENSLVNLDVKIYGPTGSSTMYQWEYVIADSNNSPINFGSSLKVPDTVFNATVTNVYDTAFYYRCKISCSGTDFYTDWRKLTVYSAMITGDYSINLDSATRYLPGAPNGMFTDYTTAIAKMKYCGIKGNGPVVRFNVQPATTGDYVEQIKIDSISGATATRRIAFKGNNTTIKFPATGPSANNERALIKLDRAHFVTLDSINIDASNPTNYAYGIQLINNADSNAIINCSIISNLNQTTTNFAGIVVGATATTATTAQNSLLLTCDSILISNNKINGAYYGIAIAGSATNQLATIKVTNNTINDFHSTGIYVAGVRNSLFEANQISRPTRTGAGYGYGISFTAAQSVLTSVSKNRIFNFYEADKNASTGASGIHFNNVDATSGSEVKVINNAIYNLGGTGIVYGLHNIGSDNIVYYHNSISIEDTISATGIAAGFYQTTAASGIVFKNNIIHVKRAGLANKFCINLQSVGVGGTSLDANNNDYSIYTNFSSNYVGNYGTNTAGLKKTISDWRAASAQDANSLSYDPLYVDSKNGDLHPQFYLIDNMAINNLATDDILNTPRPNGTPRNSDIGAFEFNVPPCPTPLLAGAATVTPSSGICLEVPIKLSLTGNSPVGQINFQWQDSDNGTSGWQNLGPLNYSPDYDTVSSVRNFYRCIVTCAASGVSVISDSVELQLNNILPKGTYYVDINHAPTTAPYLPGDTLKTFNEAVTAMQCGIRGSVVFEVLPGTYTEQVSVPYIAGTGPGRTITFQGYNNNAGGATLTFAPTLSTANYTLRYDSSMYVSFKSLNINNTDLVNARVVDFNNKPSNCSLINCNIQTAKVVAAPNTAAAVFANQFRGNNLLIKGNNILNGANGIYLTGFAATPGNLTSPTITIDSNTVTYPYGAGLHLQNTNKLVVTRNKVVYKGEAATGTAGIFASFCDSGMLLKNNTVTMDSVNGAIFGIEVINSRNKPRTGFAQINGNKVYANSGNAGKVIGLAVITSDSLMVKNNVIGINSGGIGSFGLLDSNCVANTIVNFYNNTVQISLTDTFSTAARLRQTPAGRFVLNNNIFSNIGGGKALSLKPAGNFTSNYNMLYTTGKNLVDTGTTAISYIQNINQWRKSNQDKFSIVYKPVFVANDDLRPDLNNSDVWAIHGRGTQIKGNITDINDNVRPEKLTDGVPDLGAYEFYPNLVDPPVLPSIPATPTANTEQVFYFGSDTVLRVKWDATPPAYCNIKRFSGVSKSPFKPQGWCDSMFFYVQTDVPAGYAKGNVKLGYIDPWLGSFPTSVCDAQIYQIGLAKTDANNIWRVGRTSGNDDRKREIYETDVTQFSKFTGLWNQYAPTRLPCSGDTSNAGKEFWLAYPSNQLDGGETFNLYIAPRDYTSYVTVSVPNGNGGTGDILWEGSIPIGTVKVIPSLTAGLLQKYRHQNSGLWPDAIKIESDEQVTAYAHCWGSTSSGATMLMPACTWGYEYKMLGYHQNWGGWSYSSYFVVANQNNTRIAFTNTVNTQGVPQLDTVTLNYGEWYQVLAQSPNEDLSGSLVKSVPNSNGKCYPFAMFSGDTRTLNSHPCGGGGDFAICQNFPASAWGKKFLTAPTSRDASAGVTQANLFRISLKDANQKIWINDTLVYPTGTPPATAVNFTVSGTIVPGTNVPAYISFESQADNCITSDRPMMICQFLSGACSGNGDPDMVFISPVEQGINKVNFFRNTTQTITANVLTLIGSAKDTPTIYDGGNVTTWSLIRPHGCSPTKKVYIKHWPTAAQKQVNVEGDSAFTAITYGLGSVESYMYNAGTNILSYFPAPPNPCNKDVPEDSCREYTCSKTQFQIKTAISVLKPDSIKILLSKIPGISPNKDVVMRAPYNPPPTYTLRPNGDTTWYFTLPGYYTIDSPGTYTATFQLWHPDVEGCDKKLEWQQRIRVFASPQIGFTYVPNPICPNTNVTFTAGTIDSASLVPVHDWSWSSSPYGIKKDTLKTNVLTFFYGNPGVDTVKLFVRTADYCIGDSTQYLTINPNPVVNVVKDSIHTCAGGNVTFNIQSPLVGAIYTLYDAPTGGNVVKIDTAFTFTNVTADATYYIGCVSATGCTSVDRKAVKIKVTQLPVPTAAPTSITACIGTAATFNVTNVQPNVVYNWFDVATGGSPITAGNSFNIPNVTASATYYLEASENGCTSATRFPVSLVAATPPALAVVSTAITVCSGDAATFSVQSPDATVTYNWYTTATGGTATTGSTYTINPANASASYWVSATSVNGCTTPRIQVDLTVKIRPVVTIVYPDSVTLCKGLRQTFCVQNPLAGAKYKWYNQSLGGVLVQADSSCFTTPPLVQGDTTYYVDGEKDGCTSFTRATVKIKALQELDTTSVVGTKVETNFIRFDWTAVPNAQGYKITITVNGGTPKTYTYGSSVLTYSELNLLPGDTAWATVVALGINPCQNSTSRPAFGKTVLNATFYPNIFTPNGDGKNDKIVICGSSFKDIQYTVFNQWGEKIWEVKGLVPTDTKGCYLLWDGTHRGVLQPVGVYMFASKITFLDGKVEEKKGTINLIR